MQEEEFKKTIEGMAAAALRCIAFAYRIDELNSVPADEELRKQTQIPGFRRGEKIPDKILINFIGKEK